MFQKLACLNAHLNAPQTTSLVLLDFTSFAPVIKRVLRLNTQPSYGTKAHSCGSPASPRREPAGETSSDSGGLAGATLSPSSSQDLQVQGTREAVSLQRWFGTCGVLN